MNDKSHFRLNHRPPVHRSYENTTPTNGFGNGHGSYLSSARSSNTSSRSFNAVTGADEYVNGELQVARNVFMFGSDENRNNGFSFKMGNFFRGIGNTVKNMFGLK